jgi:membrane-associated protein
MAAAISTGASTPLVVAADKAHAAAPRPLLRLARTALLAAVLLVASTSLAGPALAGPASASASLAEPSLLATAASFVLHLDKHLSALVAASTGKTYAILFAIVFAETGLVVTPFLPGDSLLFAAGTLAALGSLSLPLLMALLFVAAVAGDTVNYAAGKWLGSQAFSAYPSVFRPEYLAKTRAFFAKHGPKTIVLARFVPIVRTFAPFVAGVGTMAYPTFVLYNVAGAAIWVVTFCLAGFALGNIPAVRHNFALVTVGIVLVSLLPVLHELLEARRHDAGSGAAQ